MAVDRLTQVNETLRLELARAINLEVELPRGVVVSLTKVRISPDLSSAAVYLAVTPLDQTGTALALIRKHLGQVVATTVERVPMRRFPKLRLIVDEGARRAAHIEALLDSLK